ncbi:hypothetical protein FNB79_00865 [Formosa sediminum]|uniref:Uncharacterized protein n=1 Tax=Formosa sediminum TaxID=2594004 RepID=A0A516GMI2_9FLAO|nr:hypothetical protein [Formosa sediminum]QDO92590.1 hypothetical protein FNB79_00865 [Formosa sediminum]
MQYDLNHRFYKKNKKEQLKIQFRIVLLALCIMAFACFISWYTGFYFIAVATAIIVLTIIAPFIDTPTMKASGKLIYYSPVFITEPINGTTIRAHGGTLFDYVFVLRKSMTANQRTTYILQQQLQGLLNFIDAHDVTTSNLKIVGTSYIINEKTAKRLGFKTVNTEGIQLLILYFNYFNILLSNSIAKNKLAFPKLSKTKTFETDLNQLRASKATTSKLNQLLQQKLKTLK